MLRGDDGFLVSRRKQEDQCKYYGFFSEVCWGKVMVAYTKLQQRNKESERLRRERDQIKFIDRRFLNMASCRIQESKKKARRSISCMF